jgi:hypothetical protein
VGPYLLHEQVIQDEHSRGELYRATHETSGATALVLKPSPEEGAAPLPDWQERALAGAAAVGILVCALLRPAPVSPPPEGPWASAAPTPMRHEVPTDSELGPTGTLFWDAVDGGAAAIARPFPSKPYPGQRRPPCKPRLEVEIMGACWVPHELKAPCLEELYEYQGKCYTASMKAQPQPQSLGQ